MICVVNMLKVKYAIFLDVKTHFNMQLIISQSFKGCFPQNV